MADTSANNVGTTGVAGAAATASKTVGVVQPKPPILAGDQIELLSILQEELHEAGQIISKIMRHGYGSFNPVDPKVTQVDGDMFPNNRDLLEKEIGHVFNSLNMLVKAAEIEPKNIEAYAVDKARTIRLWLHFPQIGYLKSRIEAEEKEVLTGVKALVAKLR